MRFLPVNLDSFLIELSDLKETMLLFRHLQASNHMAIVDMIPAAKTILVQFNPMIFAKEALIDWITQQKLDSEVVVDGREIILDVHYDGEDLDSVAERIGLFRKELVHRHTEKDWQVAFIGFAPGFGYLVRSDLPFGSVPRLDSPRKKIPAGSVGLAGEYSGVYPKESPGGWQLIGRTQAQMWDVNRESPALLMPGNRIVFCDKTSNPVSVSVLKTLSKANEIEPQSTPVLEVLKSGMQTLLQDAGRLKQFSLGVGIGGALDQSAMHDANFCVGNPAHAAVLEILNGGFSVRILKPTVIAITGAKSQIQVNYADNSKATLPSATAIALDTGDKLHILPPTHGLRNYLAIRGGIEAESILGSKGFDTLAELGTPPLKSTDRLYAANMPVQAVAVPNSTLPELPKIGDVVELDIILGPRTDWFDEQSLDSLFNQTWEVSNEINRIGLRLKGEKPLQRFIQHELPSEGTCIGALQVPPNGQPVLFMNDHPLTGGYPVIAAVANYHLDLVAQIPAGCSIRFKQISVFMDQSL
ncbi:5-oxoprolinase/urea amidolyase family protein [Acinetobacter sp. MD2(2019)]|uniref:5-oxoprolinase subunit B/C family protein n=1 Tax=Acinetobacter sp. MD2(2019) TaxID=2605273 RepID=UPI002D1E687A|nr:5-oxoprolinase/urea amidolyase family protein [Acinetobacter sp. MD2(2019)]MEB3753723.1 5-oxoprolinase/urea amidolyase family protein [Acinetobacter sp. MD2(2019)]